MLHPREMMLREYKDKSLKELKKMLDERKKYLVSDELKKLSEQEDKMRGQVIFDHWDCVVIVKMQIQVLKDLIANKEKTFRQDELLKVLELPKEIRQLEPKEQYQILYDTINNVQTWIKNEYNSVAMEMNFSPSKRQRTTWQNAVMNFQKNNYLDCYYEIMDFIYNYGNRDTSSLFKEELDNVSSILNAITNKIKTLLTGEATLLDITQIDMDVNTKIDKNAIEQKYTGTAGITSIKNSLIH